MKKDIRKNYRFTEDDVKKVEFIQRELNERMRFELNETDVIRFAIDTCYRYVLEQK